MNTSRCLNMHFDDFSESFYLIKFGKKEHLEQIQNGVIRFSHIDKYKEIENEKEKEIYDKIQIFLIKEIQKITQNKKKDNPYRSR